jgi:predicted Zn-dependent protease
VIKLLVKSEEADIRIRWVENLQKVAGDTIPLTVNRLFVHVDITLGVGNNQWMAWIPYSDTSMLAITEHELGHACEAVVVSHKLEDYYSGKFSRIR